ncbi:hypothetical protein HS9_02630 [Bacillus velezensis]|nr:hypothetical protein HS9_02630 [Bacillus velezensis]
MSNLYLFSLNIFIIHTLHYKTSGCYQDNHEDNNVFFHRIIRSMSDDEARGLEKMVGDRCI